MGFPPSLKESSRGIWEGGYKFQHPSPLPHPLQREAGKGAGTFCLRAACRFPPRGHQQQQKSKQASRMVQDPHSPARERAAAPEPPVLTAPQSDVCVCEREMKLYLWLECITSAATRFLWKVYA